MDPRETNVTDIVRRSRCLSRPVGVLLGSVGMLMATGCVSPSPDQPLAHRDSQGASWQERVQQHALATHTTEFPITRLVTEGDLDADQRPDHAVVYRLDEVDGSGRFRQFLMVELSSRRRSSHAVTPLQVGGAGKEDRSVTSLRISENRVELLTPERQPGDASCCPTGWRWIGYALQGGRLEELPPRPGENQ